MVIRDYLEEEEDRRDQGDKFRVVAVEIWFLSV